MKRPDVTHNCRLILVSLALLLFTPQLLAEFRVRNVEFSGNEHFTRRELLGVMELTPQWPLNRIRFSEFRLRSDLDIIKSLYLSEGFREISIKRDVQRDSSRGTVLIQIEIDEGPRTHIRSVSVFSAKGIVDLSLISDELEIKEEVPLQISAINRDVRVIKEMLSNKGYLENSVEPEINYDPSENMADVAYRVKEGPLITVGRINIGGRGKLRNHVIRRELAFDAGDTLTRDALSRSERRLYRTGLLRYVQIYPQLGDSSENRFTLPDTTYPVRVDFNEADFLRIQAGLGFGTQDGFRASATSSYHNLFRMGHRLSAGGRLSQKKQDAELVYSFPWLYRVPVSFDTKLYYNRYDEPGMYEGVFDGLELRLGHRTDHNLHLQTWAKWENVRWVKAPEMEDRPSEIPDNPTQSLGITITRDKRNDLFNPTRGSFVMFEKELAGLLDETSNQFFKFQFDTRWYHNYRSRFFISSAMRSGWIFPYGRSSQTPHQEKFVAGGARSVRGFDENRLVVLNDGDPFMGDFYLVANVLDFRFPLFWWFEGAFFLDAGYVWHDLKEVDGARGLFNDLRWSAGPGLRINTPLMVMRIDFGFKLDREEGESVWEFHFDLGQPF
ncbi:Outer membrane protein assembly factor YaeT precursor [Chitinispirillum alkaliphilum]|nr:Outer membrane protein assembly factor YaeT precursor [Chitinispirillum alkaliphilum]